MIQPKSVTIDRIEFAEGSATHGTKVFLSDGSQLCGVLAVSQSADAGHVQTFTVTVMKGATVDNEIERQPT